MNEHLSQLLLPSVFKNASLASYFISCFSMARMHIQHVINWQLVVSKTIIWSLNGILMKHRFSGTVKWSLWSRQALFLILSLFFPPFRRGYMDLSLSFWQLLLVHFKLVQYTFLFWLAADFFNFLFLMLLIVSDWSWRTRSSCFAGTVIAILLPFSKLISSLSWQ